MLDIRLIRENPEYVKNNLTKRGKPENTKTLEKLIDLDKKWRLELTQLNNLRHKRKLLTAEIAALKKAGKGTKEIVDSARKLDTQITNVEQNVNDTEKRTHDYLMRIPNLLHETVPVGKSEHDNVQIRKWGAIPKFAFQTRNHIDLGQKLGILDIERAGKVAGSRFFFLKGTGALLDMALMSYAMEELTKKGYLAIIPPCLMRRGPYEGVTALGDFEDVLYKIENEDLYLIATSEHPMAAMFMNETLKEDELPLKLAGASVCFRREAGAHGRDTRGIFRTHQFNKIEQFVFCKPEESSEMHEELIHNAEELVQKLNIPYRVVNVCTGDIGTVAAKKYDVEAWMPAQNNYREIISCSNCTDYQARRLKIRFREKDGAPPKGFVHTLNSTAIATGRLIVAILENFQERDGSIVIPSVLRKYLGDMEKMEAKR